ncbi:hypothetical protein DFJ73DRAFT_817415 [Zopfochytrium polystomum]|nr:hypothetical protein DFJ73DRAFT_817415 [Zopfochytrium polystomum]
MNTSTTRATSPFGSAIANDNDNLPTSYELGPREIVPESASSLVQSSWPRRDSQSGDSSTRASHWLWLNGDPSSGFLGVAVSEPTCSARGIHSRVGDFQQSSDPASQELQLLMEQFSKHAITSTDGKPPPLDFALLGIPRGTKRSRRRASGHRGTAKQAVCEMEAAFSSRSERDLVAATSNRVVPVLQGRSDYDALGVPYDETSQLCAVGRSLALSEPSVDPSPSIASHLRARDGAESVEQPPLPPIDRAMAGSSARAHVSVKNWAASAQARVRYFNERRKLVQEAAELRLENLELRRRLDQAEAESKSRGGESVKVPSRDRLQFGLGGVSRVCEISTDSTRSRRLKHQDRILHSY